MSLAATRLAEERKKWYELHILVDVCTQHLKNRPLVLPSRPPPRRRKDPLFGFALKPSTKPDGTTDMMLWNARIPGKTGTLWDGAKFPVTLRFSPTDYPTAAPVVSFPAGFQHPNVFECGKVCLSLIGQAWRPSVSLKEILLGVQELLDTPNKTDPANWEINSVFMRNRAKYDA
jgi:ubiquitin-conjugating enzyme E2 I